MENEQKIDTEQVVAQEQDQEQIPPTGGEQEQEQAKEEQQAETKTYTKDEINDMIRSRLERDRTSFLNRYGVKTKDELDELIGKSQSYDIMREKYDESVTEINGLKERLAFLINGINPDREDDIRAFFKGKEMELSEDNLVAELETHPEWRKVIAQDESPKTSIEVLGVEHQKKNVSETENERIRRIYGI